MSEAHNKAKSMKLIIDSSDNILQNREHLNGKKDLEEINNKKDFSLQCHLIKLSKMMYMLL